jgi:hypothetical protein
MAKIRVDVDGHEKVDVKTFDPWKKAAEKGEKISFIDVWLAESPVTLEEKDDAEREVEHLTKLASGSDLYSGFEEELAEIKGKPYDEVLREQGQIELSKDTAEAAPKAKKATAFFPDF